jgi:steroid 5-alpha reductase family enzyme
VSWWLMILIGWATMALIMAAMWLAQRRTGNAGIVDVAWTLGVGALGFFFAAGSSDGNLERRVAVSALVMIWALRLGGHLLIRVLTLPEDGRYQSLKREWGDSAQTRMFRFYQFQALGSVLFALPMLLAAHGAHPFGALDWCACGIWLLAFVGEAAADRQLARFRASPENNRRVCRAGLWRYSRHPNYFFEWLHWWAYVVFAIATPWGWLSLSAPLSMLYFITRVTGIPPTEAQALKSRGEAYRRYQRTTSAFIPWPPKPTEGMS